MERKDGFELNEPSLVGIGRQAYGLGSGDLECQTSSCNWNMSDCNASNVSAKKSRIGDAEFWHRENDAWSNLSGDFSQAPAGSQRAKRQNCTGLMQGCQELTSCTLSNVSESGPRTGVDSKTSLIQSSRPGLFGCCEAMEQDSVNHGFDFFRTGSDSAGNSSSSSFLPGWGVGNDVSTEGTFPAVSASVEDKIGSWDGVVGLHRVGGLVDTSVASLPDGPSADAKSCGDFLVNLQLPEIMAGKGFTVDYQSRGVQAPLNEPVGNCSGSAEAENIYSRTGIGDTVCLDPSFRSYSAYLPESEGEGLPFQSGGFSRNSLDHTGNNRPGHLIGGRRSSCKRKMSTPGLADASSSRASQSFIRRESNPTRAAGGSAPATLNCSATPDAVPSATATSMIQIWDDLQHNRTSFVGHENDLFESLTSTAGKSSAVSGTSGDAERTEHNRSVSTQQDHSLSLFARNLRRSVPVARSQALFSRRGASAEQLGNVGGNVTDNAISLQECDDWAPLFGQRGSSSSAAVGNNNTPGGGIMFTGFGAPVRERVSNMCEGSRIRTMSGRPPSLVGAATMDSRLANQASTSRGSASRAMNSSEASGHTGHVGSSPMHPNTAASHLSVLLSSGRNAGGVHRNMPRSAFSSTATNHSPPSGSSLEGPPPPPAPPRMYAGPYPSVPRSSLFQEGQGEGSLAPPVQSLFGMPFCGVHMLPADREHRQRFVTEILSALEHARRSEGLSFEELVMLEPSLIYGGFDIHDQHGDMRLDVDNMSYEELLALEERIGNVSTGLNDETVTKCLRESKYSSLDATVAALSQESDMKCSICQWEYVEEDQLGTLDCGHAHHTACIKQWLSVKNMCPICKSPAYSKS